MEKVLQGLHWQTLLLYLNDILVVAKDFPTHMERIAKVFQRLRAAGLKLKHSKCEILNEKVLYLCHIASAQRVTTDPENIESIKQRKPLCT